MHPLPPLLSIEDVQARLNLIFPESFPDRTILVSDMSARAHFVSLYGGFIADSGRYFRPSTVIRFSQEQAERTTDVERYDWLTRCHLPGFEPQGKQWYADNTRETLRDDLIRNRMIPMGLIWRRQGIPPTSPAPIYSLSEAYTQLFSPNLAGEELGDAIKAWQEEYLDPRILARMRLLAHGIFEREGEVPIKLPSGKTLRLAPGEASVITRDVCEVLAPLFCRKPIVVHISMSDRKIFPELSAEANALGLALDPKAALPDVIIVNLTEKATQLVFVEVVHSDGPITELRRNALLEIAKGLGYGPNDVALVTAFEDRQADIFRKRFSEIARGTWVWFRSEPHLFMELKNIGNEHAD
ncbi:BsuBI/PstI family type II restriction endonuclease [Burkholderia ubonensis]|uniref:BsuBI/PstI family type II restriction endonuclease n=1 Tax=Burkholderia ubonensis TaxID=101571 RepID=UPI0008FDE1B6|nr:BsuBI/PstI family type II restriction endonuclease [Burkholderia ubonensis]